MLCALVRKERTFTLESCFLFLRSEKKLLAIFYLFIDNCDRMKGINKI